MNYRGQSLSVSFSFIQLPFISIVHFIHLSCTMRAAVNSIVRSVVHNGRIVSGVGDCTKLMRIGSYCVQHGLLCVVHRAAVNSESCYQYCGLLSTVSGC